MPAPLSPEAVPLLVPAWGSELSRGSERLGSAQPVHEQSDVSLDAFGMLNVLQPARHAMLLNVQLNAKGLATASDRLFIACNCGIADCGLTDASEYYAGLSLISMR